MDSFEIFQMNSDKDCVCLDCILRTNKVVIISQAGSTHCMKVIQILESYKIQKESIAVLDIDNRIDMDEILDYMQKMTGARTVPRVFINGLCIGGKVETVAAHNSGKLKDLLLKANALVECNPFKIVKKS